jgi:hypothetical protein
MNQRLNEATLSLINVLSLTNGQLGIFSEDKMIDKKKSLEPSQSAIKRNKIDMWHKTNTS